MKDMMRALNQRPIACYPIYVAITGSISAGVALSQLMYWFAKGEDKIYKTDKEFEAETGHTAKEMKVVRKHLKDLPFLTITREGVPAKTHYEIDWEKWQSSLYHWSKLKNADGIVTRKSIQESTIGTNCTVPSVHTITESTRDYTENLIVETEVVDEKQELSKSMIDAIEVAEYLVTKLSGSIDGYKRPTDASLKKWAKELERAIRLDGRTKEKLLSVIDWIHDGNGTFWIPNIKSGKKLRDQFDTLWFQMDHSKPRIPIRDRVASCVKKGEVFFTFKDKTTKEETQVCLFGDYNSLYDYKRSKYIAKEVSDKLWMYFEKHFDEIFNKESK
jgi:hypothetical protein